MARWRSWHVEGHGAAAKATGVLIPPPSRSGNWIRRQEPGARCSGGHGVEAAMVQRRRPLAPSFLILHHAPAAGSGPEDLELGLVEDMARRRTWRGGGGGHGAPAEATGILVPPPPSCSGSWIRRQGPGAMSGAPPFSLSTLPPRLWQRLGTLSSVRRRGPRARASILPRDCGSGRTRVALAPSIVALLCNPPPSRR